MLRLLALSGLVLATAAMAQTADPRVLLDLGAVAQSYSTDDDESLSELTLPIAASVALRPGLRVGARTAYASVSGDGLESLSGLGDTQVSANLQRPLGGGLVDLSLLLNLPTGQTALTQEEFATASVLALDDYAFALPSFGQGLIVSPGLTLAVPAGSGLALGFGVSHSLASSYTLFAEDSSSYAPATETLLTGGLDASLGGASTLALEGSMAIYGEDAYREETFQPGRKLAGSLRLALGGGAVRSTFLARYRHVAEGEVGDPRRPVAYLRPSVAHVRLGLAFVQPTFDLGLHSGVRYYGSIEDAADASDIDTALIGQQLLLDLGLAPTLTLGTSAEAHASFTYTLGIGEAAGASPLTGTRIGGGVRVGI